MFKKARCTVAIFRALIARAGGLENIFKTLFGPEDGARIHAKLAWLHRLLAGTMGAG